MGENLLDSLVSVDGGRVRRRHDDICHHCGGGHDATAAYEFRVDLKSTNVVNRQNTALRGSVLKTIAAFLNSEGGTLVIGVEDQGTVCGIEPDLNLLGGSKDKFEQLISSLVFEHIGAAVTPYLRLRLEDVEGHTVCVVDLERFAEPVFTKTEKGREFYVRVGNTTRALDTEETLRYIESRGSGA
jgi:predicted HTH transcriptional regulator